MKTIIVSIAMALFLVYPMMGQDYEDDLYYVPSKKKTQSVKTTGNSMPGERTTLSSSSSSSRQVTYPSSQNGMDVDAYNRRYSGSSQDGDYAYKDSLDAYNENVNDEEEDYRYTKNIIRFNNPTLVLNVDPYWDSWGWPYNGWYSPGWSFSWNWGGGPGWGGYYGWYDPWYNPWYPAWRPGWGGGPGWHYPHYGWRPVYRNVSNRPDRNSGFNRNNRGSYSGDSRGNYNNRGFRGSGTRTNTRTNTRDFGNGTSVNTPNRGTQTSPSSDRLKTTTTPNSRSNRVTPSTNTRSNVEIPRSNTPRTTPSYNTPSRSSGSFGSGSSGGSSRSSGGGSGRGFGGSRR